MRCLVVVCALIVAADCGPAVSSRDPGDPGRSSGGEQVLAYSVITVGRRAGDAELRIEPDGRRLGHFTYNDRGRGPDVHSELRLDDRGAPRWLRVTGHDYYKAPVDSGSTRPTAS